MGVLWNVWSLTEEMRAWLDETEVEYPRAPSRLPTGREIKEVIGALEGFDVKINDNGLGATWQASIVSKNGGDIGEWTLLNISEYAGDDDEQQLWFEKGWESLMVRILETLSKATGPLVLLADTGDPPIIIHAI